MPVDLPQATPATRALSAREDGDGFDTQVASFFGAELATEEEADTLIESADLGRSARHRARDRVRAAPKGLKT
jgi:hypothetical protein